MMCYLGLTQHLRNVTDHPDKNVENPYANITDYDSMVVPSKNFSSLEAAMADIFARDFMLKMNYNLKEKMPL